MRERVFTPAECELPMASLAARFAAKEALAKALGAPSGLHWHDCEIVKDDEGRPTFRLSGSVEARAVALRAHTFISHSAMTLGLPQLWSSRRRDVRSVFDVAELRAAERRVLKRTLPLELMGRASIGLARTCALLLQQTRGKVYGSRVVLLVGSGNNGGDALFAGR